MRRSVITVIALGVALSFAACSSSNAAPAPAAQPLAGQPDGVSGPTSISGAPRGASNAWTTPAPVGAPAYVGPTYVGPTYVGPTQVVGPPDAPVQPAAPAGSCGGGKG